MNAMAMILNADKVFPEPLTLELDDAEYAEEAELLSRLTRIGQIVSELKKIVAADLAGKLGDQAFRYGDTVYRASNGRGTAKVQDADLWWNFVELVLDKVEPGERGALLSALYPASALRLTALPKLAQIADMTPESVKDTFIAYDPPSTPLSVMPLDRAPKYLQDLEEGELR